MRSIGIPPSCFRWLLASALLVCGADPVDAARQQTAAWRVVEELRIGGADTAEAPYRFQGARNVIPDARGRFWVLDPRAFLMRLFDANGVYLRTVGGSGQRAGEFAANPCAFAGPNGEIWVEDGLRRWQRFDDEGALVGTLAVKSNIGCGIRRWLPDGRFLVVMSDQYAPGPHYDVYRLNPNGELVAGETIFPPELPETPTVSWSRPSGGTFRSAIPFIHRSSTQITPDGDFWVTDGGGRYAIRRVTPAGDTVAVITRAHDPVPIPDSIRIPAIRQPPQAGFERPDQDIDALAPRVYPPFESFYVATDGSVWVRRRIAGGSEELDVFSEAGRFIGRVAVPASFRDLRLLSITSDKIYGVLPSADGVYNVVVRFGIRRPVGQVPRSGGS